MGTVITFPAQRSGREGPPPVLSGKNATVVILPVIRIERYDDEPVAPTTTTTTRRKRRKR